MRAFGDIWCKMLPVGIGPGLWRGIDLRAEDGYAGKAVVTADMESLITEVIHRGVVPLILGENVEVPLRFDGDELAELGGEDEVQGVLPGRFRADQFDRAGGPQRQQGFEKGEADGVLFLADKEMDRDRSVSDQVELQFLHVLEIHQDVVGLHGWGLPAEA